MSTFLAVNGVTLPVAHGSAKDSIRSIGSDSTAYSGAAIRQRLTTKYDLEVETTPMLADTAFAWASFIRGEGQYWSFASHLYSSKGVGPTSSTGVALDGTEYKHAASGISVTAGNAFGATAVYSAAVGCTLMFWYEVTAGAGFTHYITTKQRDLNTYYWTNGATKTAGTPAPTGLSTSIGSGDFSLGMAAATRYLDEVVLLPFVIPDDWASSLYTFHNSGAWTALPRLSLSGDAIWETSTTRSVVGFCESASMLSGYVSSSFEANNRTLSVLFKGA